VPADGYSWSWSLPPPPKSMHPCCRKAVLRISHTASRWQPIQHARGPVSSRMNSRYVFGYGCVVEDASTVEERTQNRCSGESLAIDEGQAGRSSDCRRAQEST